MTSMGIAALHPSYGLPPFLEPRRKEIEAGLNPLGERSRRMGGAQRYPSAGREVTPTQRVAKFRVAVGHRPDRMEMIGQDDHDFDGYRCAPPILRTAAVLGAAAGGDRGRAEPAG